MLTNTWELIDMMVTRLENQSGPLGLQYVGKYDEKIIPRYPAVVVVPGGRQKVLHGLHTFQINSSLHLYIYHAKLNLTKRERSKKDLQLVTNIEQELDSDFRWADDDGNSRIIHGYVTDEEHGVFQPRANKTDLVISTRLTWIATSQRRF